MFILSKYSISSRYFKSCFKRGQVEVRRESFLSALWHKGKMASGLTPVTFLDGRLKKGRGLAEWFFRASVHI